MSSIVQQLNKQKVLQIPNFVAGSIQYETYVGSMVYGVSQQTSDIDIYGFCIPPKEEVFTHLGGEIRGFGKQINRFNQWQQHHVTFNTKEYDMQIYNIVKYFQLCMENNPNMIDSLFTPTNYVTHSTKIGDMVRDNRLMFLHKGCYQKLKGYAYSQMNKIRTKNPSGKRKELVEKYSYDTKFGYHVVRLMLQAKDILINGDLDLQKNREHLKAIRRGEWSLEQLEDFFVREEKCLEKLYTESKLRHKPDEGKIKQLLIDCLEEFYGDMSGCVVVQDSATIALMDIKRIIDKVL